MLEEALAANTAALEKNTAAAERLILAIEATNEGRASAVAAAEALKSGASEEGKTTRTRNTKAKEEGSKAVDYSGDAGFEKLRAVAASYTGVNDEKERDARKAVFARALEKAGGKDKNDGKVKLSVVPEERRAELAGWLQALAKGETVEGISEPPKAEEEEDDMMG